MQVQKTIIIRSMKLWEKTVLNEARAEEDTVFLELKANINTYKPFLSSDDKIIYKEQFKPRRKEYDIRYRIMNKDKRKIQKRSIIKKTRI
jgi:hypothetical protein